MGFLNIWRKDRDSHISSLQPPIQANTWLPAQGLVTVGTNQYSYSPCIKARQKHSVCSHGGFSEVRHAFGGRLKLIKTTGTSNKAEAMNRPLPIFAQWKADIQAAKDQKTLTREQWLQSQPMYA